MDTTKYEIEYREEFQFFRVSNEYISFLKEIDNNVCDNYDEDRMHIGIIIQVNHQLYVAPLTSKGKVYLKTIKKYKRIVFEIDNGDLGFVRIGNMIPVPKSELKPVFIVNVKDTKYKDLLLDQYIFLRKEVNRTAIRTLANKLYTKRYHNDKFFLADIMCNFKELEKACKKWEETH